MTRPQPETFLLEPATHRPGNRVSAHGLTEGTGVGMAPGTLEASDARAGSPWDTGHNEQMGISGELWKLEETPAEGLGLKHTAVQAENVQAGSAEAWMQQEEGGSATFVEVGGNCPNGSLWRRTEGQRPAQRACSGALGVEEGENVARIYLVEV